MNKNCTIRYIAIGTGVLLASMLMAAPLELSRQTIDGGGLMHSAGGSLELSSTIGQPDAGFMDGGTLELAGGFWFPLTEGDCNEDGAVDPGDYAQFTLCDLGPNNPIVEALCGCFDVNQSHTVDLADFAIVQLTFAGP